MRNRIKWLLIRLANYIGTKENYDLGEPIKALTVFKNRLFVATEHSLYRYKENHKFEKIKQGK